MPMLVKGQWGIENFPFWHYLITGKVENFHGHVNFNLQYVNLDLHFL